MNWLQPPYSFGRKEGRIKGHACKRAVNRNVIPVVVYLNNLSVLRVDWIYSSASTVDLNFNWFCSSENGDIDHFVMRTLRKSYTRLIQFIFIER